MRPPVAAYVGSGSFSRCIPLQDDMYTYICVMRIYIQDNFSDLGLDPFTSKREGYLRTYVLAVPVVIETVIGFTSVKAIVGIDDPHQLKPFGGNANLRIKIYAAARQKVALAFK